MLVQSRLILLYKKMLSGQSEKKNVMTLAHMNHEMLRYFKV